MLQKVYGASLHGIDAIVVTVQVNVSRGIRFYLVGLPDNAVRESHQRIISAFGACGQKFPTQQVVINLAPADIRKEGSAYDLPIAIGILAAAEAIKARNLDTTLFIGELGLDGTLMPVRGALSIAMEALHRGFRRLVLPSRNAAEAAAVTGIDVLGADSLAQVIRYLQGDDQALLPFTGHSPQAPADPAAAGPDFASVKGQTHVRRALEVAAAGSHNILLSGPPGSGKSLMARCLPSILPPLSLDESLETTRIHSVAGLVSPGSGLITQRPFRSPHHTISAVAMVGGGSIFMPGEICLSHNGLLYLDELTEYPRYILETLRQPLEERRIVISRASYNVNLPCSFMLVASMNPCPCGYYGDPTHQCVCSPGQIQRYRSKISGPLLDRLDLQCDVQAVPFSQLSLMQSAESSSSIRERVCRARLIQAQRFASVTPQADAPAVHCNSQMTERMIHEFCRKDLDSRALQLLSTAMERLHLSARAYSRILKVARTIADLDSSPHIQGSHIAEAISYRSMDRRDCF